MNDITEFDALVRSHEDSIIGAAAMEPSCTVEISAIVKPSDFTSTVEREVFRLICDLYKQSPGVHVGGITAEMRKRELYSDDHNALWLGGLITRASVNQAITYDSHELLRLSKLRRLQRVAVEATSPRADPDLLLSELNECQTSTLNADTTVPAASILVEFMARVQSGNLPQLIEQYEALHGIEIGPGLVTINGAPPGAGKTAMASQIMFDALALNPDLRAVVANAETTFDGLLRRELGRMTRIDSKSIRFGNLTPDDLIRLNKAAAELIPRLQRVSVLSEPNNLMQLMRLRNEPPGLVIVDYLQKFAPPDKDARQGVGLVMAGCRELAKCGWAVLALSATARTPGGKHSAKDLTLSSFRESGEIEYNADSAYLMLDKGPIDEVKPYVVHVTLQHVKNRHGAKRDHELQFHMPRMEFTVMLENEPQGFDEFGSVTEVDMNDPFYSEVG